MDITFPYVPSPKTPMGVDVCKGTVTFFPTREQAEELFSVLFDALTSEDAEGDE